jgi:hypothetical protein
MDRPGVAPALNAGAEAPVRQAGDQLPLVLLPRLAAPLFGT